jgi:transcriptional regulator PpsR
MHNVVETVHARAGALAEADGRSIAALLAAVADVVLVLDPEAVVRDVAVNDGDASLDQARGWLGRPWPDTVAAEGRPRIEAMLAEAREEGVSCRRQVTHPAADGPDLPVEYAVVRAGRGGDLVAIGRDLRTLAQLRKQLVEVQQTLERDYLRMRQLEARYRLLWQHSAEAMVLLDAQTMKVVEANPAAGQLLGTPADAMPGKVFPFGLDPAGHRAASEHLVAVRAGGCGDSVPVTLASEERGAVLAASLVRQDSTTHLLVRLLSDDLHGAPRPPSAAARVASLIEAAPDACVVADPVGRVLTANRAFLDLVQVTLPEEVRGQSLGEWIGRPGADLPLLLATLRQHGAVRLFSTAVRGKFGSTAEVELSAVAAAAGEEPCVGIILRDVSRRLANGPVGARHLTRAVEELTGLVGRVSLRDLVRDTVDLVEGHFIEAALELSRGNRTSAAEVLGLSRQSLYVKLRRYHMAGAPPNTEGS